MNGDVRIFAFELVQNVRGILRTDVPKSVDLRQEAIRRRSRIRMRVDWRHKTSCAQILGNLQEATKGKTD